MLAQYAESDIASKRGSIATQTSMLRTSRASFVFLLCSFSAIVVFLSKNSASQQQIPINMKQNVLDLLKGLGPVITEICEAGGTAGLSIGVAHQGKLVHTTNFGYQNREKSIKPDVDTLYATASISKVFTAAAVGSLVADGKLTWTTLIKDIIPELKSKSRQVTEELSIVDLLTHRTGLEKSNNWWFGSDGVALLQKAQTVSSWNALRPVTPFRTKFEYSNWNYILAREVIERLSGMTYGQYLEKTIFKPLNMSRTTTNHDYKGIDNFAVPYAALDDGSLVQLPAPAAGDDEIILGAQGVVSSVNDLLKFATSLLSSLSDPSGRVANADKQVSGQIFRQDSIYDQSYGLGIFRVELPGTVGGGCNSQYGKLPTIQPGNEARQLLFHYGSMAGYSCYITMLPELEISFAVLTNSIGLADPSGWVNELLITTLTESPSEIDFIGLAKDAARNHVAAYPAMEQQLEEDRAKGTKPTKSLSDYVGHYINTDHEFDVEVRLKEPDILQMALQGLDSQLWDLRHIKHDTFSWFKPRDEHARRARFTYAPASVYRIIFELDDEDNVVSLLWPHDPSVPERELKFVKGSKDELVQQGQNTS